PVRRHQRTGQIRIQRRQLGIETQPLPERFDGFVVLAEPDERRAEAVECEGLARIRRGPRPRELERLVPRLFGISIIPPGNEEAFPLAHALAQLECTAGQGRREAALSGIRIDPGKERERECEIWIELDRTLQVRYGLEPRIHT